jgi:23S rRNA A2030 N6-methylase RlmJ
MDHSRTVAHVPKKKRKRVLKIDPNFDPKLRYKSIKKKTAKKGPAKRGARK